MENSIVIWVLMTTSFMTYFIISMVYKRLGIRNLECALLTSNGLRLLNLKHVVGIILFGVVFYAITPELRSLINTIEVPRIPVLLSFLTIFFLSGYVSHLSVGNNTFKKDHISHYRFSKAWVYFLIRFTFLLCYEFFFRGILLYKFLEIGSVYASILYCTVLYVLIHCFDSRKEILGAIPFGVVLCVFTFLTNSIWYAFFIHMALSAVYEISMFYSLTLKKSTL
ncbi:CPBP family intramembrane glutamic endopeptidase [Geojedonia litorea]|uniref:CPBP family intramembrane glutamic endopeptidase n=1 Tax=Geojedonia litorea TaxID=1268269 RepID=A0ABV9N776_9FLAO